MTIASSFCMTGKENLPEAIPVGKLESAPVGRLVSIPVGRAERFEVKPVGSEGSPDPTGRPDVRPVGTGRVTGTANKVDVDGIGMGILGVTSEVTPVGNAEVGRAGKAEVGRAGTAGTAGIDAPTLGIEAIGSGGN